MKSIMQDERRTCYLCTVLHDDVSTKYTEEHHVIFGNTSGRRKQSEKHGLKVYLCPEHHRLSAESVHKNIEISRMLQAKAQLAFEKTFPELDFRKIFGMEYKNLVKNNENVKEDSGESGFKLIDNGLIGGLEDI